MSEVDEGGKPAVPQLATNAPSVAPNGAMFSIRVFGCPVYFGIDILVCALVLAFALVPASGAGGMDSDGWAMWAAGIASGTVIAVLLHEFAHALVVLVFGLGLRHIFVGFQGGHTALLRINTVGSRSFFVFIAGPIFETS